MKDACQPAIEFLVEPFPPLSIFMMRKTRPKMEVCFYISIQFLMEFSGICVANHTSPLDVMILSTDNVYALVGQSHGGLLGFIQRTLSRASSHIWFERSEAKDRSLVTNILKEHVDDPNKLPILIFPEGTCINNTSVMMFKKGSFEVRAGSERLRIGFRLALKFILQR